MNFVSIKNNEDKSFLSFAASIILHGIVIFAAAFLLRITIDDSAKSNQYVQVITSEVEKKNDVKFVEENLPLKKIEEKAIHETKPKLEEKREEILPPKNKIEESIKKSNAAFLNFSETNADTNNLNEIYKESTLNVSIRYPKGWTYIDQNVKKKLDGVTFWSVNVNFNPPPYIHLEVKEKYLFNPSRFKYKKEEKNFIIYYNDPVELERQVTQIIYIRTEEDEDFSIKLIMNGRESFKIFQPEFFGMIKTFKFGNSYF